MTTNDRRLIEDYLPLDMLNAPSRRKRICIPCAMWNWFHYWSARRLTTACRAAIYAALAPAPRTDSERDEEPRPLLQSSLSTSPIPHGFRGPRAHKEVAW